MAPLSVLVNGRRLRAKPGMSLLEAARAGGFILPQECGTGECESCRVRLESGTIEAGGSAIGATILACKAKLTEDVAIGVDPSPREMRARGEVRAISRLAQDVSELVIALEAPMPYLPGQYVKLSLPGLPERRYCPTLSLDGLRELDCLHFHLRHFPDGMMPAKLGQLRPGAKVRLRGPYGSGFLRQGEGRLILVSSHTGFAPLWSIAVAARLGQPHRPLQVIASAHDPRGLYMRPAFEWLAKHGVEQLILTASGATPLPPARYGRALAHLPSLRPGDTVHVAGAPAMVEAIMRQAAQSGAAFHGIPFHQEAAPPSLAHRLGRVFQPMPG